HRSRMWLRRGAHQAAHERLRADAAQAALRTDHEGDRDLGVTVHHPAAPLTAPTTPGPRRARVPGAAGTRAAGARHSRGAATAETVMVLPLLVALALALAWLVALAATQVRVVDSAREVA